jgi:excinuclease ABC subunit C
MIRCQLHEKLTAKIRETVPSVPGVYLFINSRGEVIYIGKSINLRDRMLAYFRQDYDKVEARIGQMIQSIEAFDYCVAETELQALLAEDQLIKVMNPAYNIKQKEYEEYRYVVMTDDRFPTLKMVEHSDINDNGRLYGPFPDRYFVADLLRLIQRYLNVRSCVEPEPEKYCMNYEIERCAGPCRGVVSTDAYQKIVDRVVEFLGGDEKIIVEAIMRDMDDASSKQLYEKAEMLKKRLDYWRRFCEKQKFISRFKMERLVLSEGQEKGTTHIFEKGQWISGGIPVLKKFNRENHESAEHKDSGDDPRFIVDRAHIVFSWIGKNASGCTYHFGRTDI